MSVYEFYGVAGVNFLCVKPSGTLAVKILNVDLISTAFFYYSINVYTGGGTLTGGSTITPIPLRSGAPAASATVKSAVTAVSGTAHAFVSSKGVAANATESFVPKGSLILGGGSNVVFAVSLPGSSADVYVYFDEQRLQGGF